MPYFDLLLQFIHDFTGWIIELKINLFSLMSKIVVKELQAHEACACGRSAIAKETWQSTHPRKFGNHVTVRPTVRTTGIPMFTLTLRSYFGSPGSPGENWFAHQCCDELTAVKTRYPLTSITWPYRWLRCRPIQDEYFFEVIRWQVTSFQMIVAQVIIF